MTIRERYEILVKKAQEIGDLDLVEIMVRKIINYHNNVVDMEAMISIQRFRFDQDDFVNWLSEQNARRIMSHKAMIDAVIILNRFSKISGLDLFYDGKVDEDLRYDDSDTRFGIAKFADDFCSEIFNAGFGDKI